ncbi:MAG: hypothetical protein AMJ43_03405 [Coxiella sp. DG_40]|nr:MAG: hypothetical protein AMJ43_03405 [Coxiella sp. DG_40]
MKKSLKIIGTILAVLIILFVLSIVALVTLVNPNQYKGKISEVVYQQTGRELTIAGDISWSFFPWIGIEVNDVTLSNAPQFKDRVFAKVGKAGIGVRLLPLIYGHVEAGKLLLRDLSLHLIKNKQGLTNWQDLVDKAKAKPEKVTHTPSTPISKRITLVSISDVDVKNANVFWNNEQIGQTVKIQNFRLRGKGITLQRAFNLSSSFDFQTTKPDYSGSLDLSSKVIFNPNKDYYGLQNLRLTSYIKTPEMKDKVAIKCTADTILNLEAQTFTAKNLSAQIANLNINGDIEGNKILKAPLFTGNLDIPTFNPRQLLKSFGKDIQVQDDRALQSVSAKLTFQASPNLVKVPLLRATLDQSVLRGDISEVDINRKFMNFNLALNQIDLDRYSLKETTTKAKTKSDTGGVSTGNLPGTFNKWIINGDLKVDQLTLSKLNFDQLSVPVNANKGLITLNPIKANFYRGTLNANVTVNTRYKTPQMYLSTDLKNIQLDPLLADYTDARSKIDGTANLNTRLNSKGSDTSTILKNLNGNGNVAVRNGELRDFNVNYLLQFIDILSTKQFSSQKAEAGDTEFANLTGTFNIKNGLLTNNDLIMNASNYRITGEGTANLVDQTLNYRLKAMKISTVVENGQQIQKTSSVFVPIKISGTFSKPRYIPSVADIAREATEQYGKKVIEKITNGNGGKDIGEQIKEGIGKLFR